jgi:hypothetical protein
MTGPRRIELEGTWHVVATNFPMWTDGRRARPRFTYAALPPAGGHRRLLDTVSYLQEGRERRLVGTDTEDPAAPGRYLWRGRGLLWLFRSRWQVVAAGPALDWVALRFERTWATPAGADVIAREPGLDEAALGEALQALGHPRLVRLPMAARG